MAATIKDTSAFSFSDFPEDVQLCILSFLGQSDLAKFECTSKLYLSLCRDDPRLWFAMCDRRWGSKTLIKKWGSGKISYKFLYKTLLEYENLIGFWRRSGTATSNFAVPSPSSLVFFDWGPFYITGSRVSPSKSGAYDVIKSTFLWISLTSRGQPVNYIDLEGNFDLTESLIDSAELGNSENDLIEVDLSFMGNCHFVLEEHRVIHSMNSSSNGALSNISSSGNVIGEESEDASAGSTGSFPDRLMSEIYQYIANRTSPGGNGSSRRQRRREREKHGWKKLEPEHFVKILNCSPVPSRPLQGLWKGISDDMNLEFYLITYDDIGGMSCRRVGDSSRFFGHTPVFWTSSTALIEPPFSAKEQRIYESRIHLRPSADDTDDDIIFGGPSTELDGCVFSGMLHMTSSYDLVIPGTTTDPRQGEGRVWRYKNGTIGFGFLRNNYIIDLKYIAQDGHLLDALDLF